MGGAFGWTNSAHALIVSNLLLILGAASQNRDPLLSHFSCSGESHRNYRKYFRIVLNVVKVRRGKGDIFKTTQISYLVV